MAVALQQCIFDPMLVNLKCVSGAEGSFFFNFSKICLYFSAVYLQFFKKITASQTHFGFTNIGSNMHCFRDTVIYF